MAAGPVSRPRDRLLRHERGPAAARKPRHASTATASCWNGSAPTGTPISSWWRKLQGRAARRPASRSCCRAPSTSARPRTSAARCASAPTRRPRRSTSAAAPSTTRTCSSSTPSFLPTSAAVNPALTIAAQALRVADHIRTEGACGMTTSRTPGRARHRRPPRHRPRHRAGTGRATASTSPSPASAADGSAEAVLAALSKRRRARRCSSQADLADVAGHAATVDAIVAALRPHRLPRQQCRHRRRSVRGDFLDLDAGEFRHDHRHQPARHRVLHAGRAARHAAPAPTAQPRSIDQHHLGLGRDDLAGAAGLLHVQGRPCRLHARRWRCGSPETGIAVFEIRPGIIRSDMTAKRRGEIRRADRRGLVPAKRWGEPEDVGRDRRRARRRRASPSPPARSSTSTAAFRSRGFERDGQRP